MRGDAAVRATDIAQHREGYASFSYMHEDTHTYIYAHIHTHTLFLVLSVVWGRQSELVRSPAQNLSPQLSMPFDYSFRSQQVKDNIVQALYGEPSFNPTAVPHICICFFPAEFIASMALHWNPVGAYMWIIIYRKSISWI